MPSLVSAVLVHHKDAGTTLESIESILASDYPRLSLVVVDCAPENEAISSKVAEKKIVVMKAFSDPGASAARNIGIRRGMTDDPEYVLVSDSDVVFQRGCLSVLVKRAMTNDRIGAVQPKVLSRHDPRLIDTVGQRVAKDGAYDVGMGDLDGPAYQTPRDVFGVSLAAALYSSKALTNVGLCDEHLRFMFEDVDLSWRIRLAGYTCAYEPTAIAYHIRRSTGLGDQSLRRRSLQWRNWLLISTRYFPSDFLARTLLQSVVRALVALLIELLKGNGGASVMALARGEARSLCIRQRLQRHLGTRENRSFISG
jgi:GT2 family glycosyltransferase